MNWLAHLVLSPDDPEDRIGNWLADVLPAAQVEALGPGFAKGLRRHREIDRFTDRHAVTRQSRQRLPKPLRLAAGVFVDVFFDHFLSRDFPAHTGLALPSFLSGVHCDFAGRAGTLPAPAPEVISWMLAEQWLGCYGTLQGVELTLTRIRRRLSPRAAAIFNPQAARAALEDDYDGFAADFSAFWPELQQTVTRWDAGSIDRKLGKR